MKSDSKKFRRYCRLSFVFMLLAVATFVCSSIFVGGAIGAAIGVTVKIALVALAACGDSVV